MRFLSVFIATLCVATAAQAHTGAGGASGLTQGLLHPLGGLDHVLAMVGIGALAFFLGGRALWLVPASFLGMMAVGGALGFAGFGLPFIEVGIALSVVAIGAALTLGLSLPLAGAMALAGGFAVFHGLAHGAEMPAMASGLGYGFGFLAATAALHGLGLALGFGLNEVAQETARRVARIGGALLSLSGLAILTGVF
ncbi:MAG: urease accessory protein [Kiloniellaceae bacterium]|nr:urease accessory protein [Kiloniellaceae bacterium]